MTEELAALVNTELKRCIRFVKKVPGWKDINMEDQINLIKGLSLSLTNEPQRKKSRSSGFPNRFETNPSVQLQKKIRSLKFRI